MGALGEELRNLILPKCERRTRRGGPEHLRDALFELGPRFMKLGQVLSTRPDLIPPPYEEALSSLQDAAPAVPFAAVREAISHELSQGTAQAYVCIAEEPIASASIGQVHAARLLDGTEVVVKVRRPGIIATVESDLAILHSVARLANFKYSPLRFDLVGFERDFAATLQSELDYLAEGRNADRIRPILTALGVHVPHVIWDMTTSAVLTLERVPRGQDHRSGETGRDGCRPGGDR